MKKIRASLPWLILGVVFSLVQTRAVENGTNSSFNTTAPTGSNIPNWGTGWTQPQGQTGVTGWNYVGIVAGGGGSASGVYLGNGWVLTAGHVGAAPFTLGGGQYLVVSGSVHQGIPWQDDGTNYTADVTLFQIQPDGMTTFSLPNLPSLTIATSSPVPYHSSVAIIGYGDGGSRTNETWGLNTVTTADELVEVESFGSADFVTAYGTTTEGLNSATNNYFLVVGDSGGGDFIYNSSHGSWQLVGMNEAVGTAGDGNNDTNYSYFVDLSAYASQINAIVSSQGVPAMPAWGRVVVPLLILLVAAGYLAKRKPIS